MLQEYIKLFSFIYRNYCFLHKFISNTMNAFIQTQALAFA